MGLKFFGNFYDKKIDLLKNKNMKWRIRKSGK